MISRTSNPSHAAKSEASRSSESKSAFYDGIYDHSGQPRESCAQVAGFLDDRGVEGLRDVQREVDLSLLNQGITFTVYGDERGAEKIFPLDIIPRIVDATRWAHVERGLQQRIHALNLFLSDLYGDQKIIRDGLIPADLVLGSPEFCRAMMGLRVPGDVFVHVSGTDLIENERGELLVLEDNARVPSGVSYVLENRIVMSRVVPDLLKKHRVRGVDHYPQLLFDALRGLSRRRDPQIAILTPGIYNSAYFEHSFLAAQMGVELLEGRDLVVDNDVLYMKTTSGLRRVDVLYRRVDDSFLDPLAFRVDSVLGIPGLMNAYRAGNLVLANAPGTGVIDDKAMYSYIPEAIRYYLGEEPVLDQIPTYLGRNPKDAKYILSHLRELVVKPNNGSGGYGLLIGSTASRTELETMRSAIQRTPERFVAQPIQKLSTLPTFIAGPPSAVESRHVDLRPFAISQASDQVEVLPGGLTRVALRAGSLIVNSSQGGGSKDTWVLRATEGPE